MNQQIEDVKQIQKTILEKLSENFDFKKTGEIGPLTDEGKIFRKITMSDLRSWTGRTTRCDDFDAPLLTALDNISKAGKLLIFNARYHPDLEYHDIQLIVEIGEGCKNFQGAGPPKIEITKLYSKLPLSKKQRQDRKAAIPEIKLELERLREARDKRFRERFGASGLAVESQLHREDIQDEIDLKRRLIQAIEKVERMAAE